MGNVIQASDITVAQIQGTDGVIIYDENSTWDGNPIEWEVIGKDQDGQGTITVQTKRSLASFAWDSKNTDGITERQQAGANRVDSLLHQWLNSNSENWYSSQHSNQAPSEDTVSGYSLMSSDARSGFMTRLSTDFKSNLVEVSKNITASQIGDPSTFTGKLFCLSVREVDPTYTINFYIEEQGAFTYSRYQLDSKNRRDKEGPLGTWWLRSPRSDDSYGNFRIADNGEMDTGLCYYAYYCAAPACVLSSDIFLEEDANGKYKILFSDPPTPTHEDEYLDYDGLVEIANRTERKFRFSEMPTPGASWLGKSIQYIGDTTVTEPIYTKNYFYECKTKTVEGQTVYYWDIADPIIKPITNAQIDAWWNGGN